MKTDPIRIKGFWQKKANQFWNTEMYTDETKKELNIWAKSLYKENIKEDFIKK